MSKRQFKSQASSSRAVFGNGAGFGGFGSGATRSTLSYLTEPPNLSAISDPNVVVAFKNLLKKDSTTKAKGLEDLRLHVLSSPHEQGGGVEQSILEAWVRLLLRLEGQRLQCTILVIYLIGQIISSHLNRQFPPST
jgi:hypothetical protein